MTRELVVRAMDGDRLNAIRSTFPTLYHSRTIDFLFIKKSLLRRLNFAGMI